MRLLLEMLASLTTLPLHDCRHASHGDSRRVFPTRTLSRSRHGRMWPAPTFWRGLALPADARLLAHTRVPGLERVPGRAGVIRTRAQPGGRASSSKNRAARRAACPGSCCVLCESTIAPVALARAWTAAHTLAHPRWRRTRASSLCPCRARMRRGSTRHFLCFMYARRVWAVSCRARRALRESYHHDRTTTSHLCQRASHTIARFVTPILTHLALVPATSVPVCGHNRFGTTAHTGTTTGHVLKPCPRATLYGPPTVEPLQTGASAYSSHGKRNRRTLQRVRATTARDTPVVDCLHPPPRNRTPLLYAYARVPASP